MSLWSKLSKFLTAEQRERVLAVGQTMADKNGVVFMTDVVLTIFLEGLKKLESE